MTLTTRNTDQGGVTGNYAFTVSGSSSGFASRSTAGALAIQDFTVGFSSNWIVVTTPTGTPSFQITAGGINGFNDSVSLYLSWQQYSPYATGPNFDHQSITPGQTSTMSFTMQNDPRNLCFPFTITALGRGVTHYLGGTLCAQSSGNFSMGVSPSTLMLTPPINTAPGGYTVSITPQNNYSGTVTFSASGLPNNATATFTPAALSVSGTSTMTTVMSINAPAGTQAGTFVMTVTANGTGGVSQSVCPLLTIGGPADFSLTATQSTQTVAPGGVATYLIGVSGAPGFSGSVTLSASGLPQGVTAGFSPGSVAPGGSSTLTLTSSANSPAGNFSVTVTGTSGSLSRTTVAFLNVSSPSAAKMLTPGPGTVLRSGVVNFTWDAGLGVSQYQLALGSTPGGSDYYFANMGSGLNATVVIPTVSQPQSAYATLSSLMQTGWQSQSYAYRIGPYTTTVPQAAQQTGTHRPPATIYTTTTNRKRGHIRCITVMVLWMPDT